MHFLSHSVRGLWSLVRVSFWVQVVKVVQSHLSMCAFLVCAFDVNIEEIIPKSNVMDSPPVFFSKSFAVWGISFRSLIHFELISV